MTETKLQRVMSEQFVLEDPKLIVHLSVLWQTLVINNMTLLMFSSRSISSNCGLLELSSLLVQSSRFGDRTFVWPRIRTENITLVLI